MPAFNEIDPPAPYDTLTSLNPFLDPMRSTTFEVGARGTIGGGDQAAAGRWPGTFAYDTAVYWIGVEDEIVPQDGGAFFLSAGESRVLHAAGVALALERRRPGLRRLGVHQRHERRVLRARAAA
jgi:hypothetical protein